MLTTTGKLVIAFLTLFARVFLACGAVYSIPEPSVPPEYSEIKEACEPHTMNGVAHYTNGEFTTQVSAECSEVIGAAFYLDWESFDELAHDFTEPRSPAELVVGGLLMLTAANNVTVSEAVDEQAPQNLAQELESLLEDSEIDDSADSARLWFAFLQGTISSIDYQPSNDYTMRYHTSTGLVSVGDISDAIPPNSDIWLPDIMREALEISSILVHEGGHAFYGEHGVCEGEAHATSECDNTINGSYGAGAWWAHLWLHGNIDELDERTCWEAANTIEYACEHINEIDGWLPCEYYFHACYDG